MATVADIMDRSPVTVRPEASLETVLHTLSRHELPGVPVVNEAGRCLGIITGSDLVLSDEQGELHLPHFIELFGGVVFLEPLKRFEDRLRKATAATARDLMTPDPLSVEPQAPVRQAARLIAESGHNRLPVIEHGRFVGVVTRLDVLEAIAKE